MEPDQPFLFASISQPIPTRPRVALPVFVTKYRAAFPSLRQLPLQSSSGAAFQLPKELQRHSITILKRARGILEQYGILDNDDDEEVDILFRQVPLQPSTAKPTIFIIAKWTNGSARTWPMAVECLAMYIQTLFQTVGYEGHLDVEMIALERVNTKYLGPVLNRPDLEQAWPGLKDFVKTELLATPTTRNTLTSIALFRLGYSRDIRSNPITIYITLDHAADETQWDTVTSDIESKLRGLGWPDLVVHMEHDTIDYFVQRAKAQSDMFGLCTGHANSRRL
ncbi:hypothetical protein B0T10DRAFT_594374 [Thelonectria olida]|uniref:Uncharacterized protein n=1 Tax=Thelonectria olida TaxID=1576542 RepID=A0A9P8WBP2_9HYPO|nr:hypothetical protein B0T10DRAFT_594374 [Thelonectria olida]